MIAKINQISSGSIRERLRQQWLAVIQRSTEKAQNIWEKKRKFLLSCPGNEREEQENRGPRTQLNQHGQNRNNHAQRQQHHQPRNAPNVRPQTNQQMRPVHSNRTPQHAYRHNHQRGRQKKQKYLMSRQATLTYRRPLGRLPRRPRPTNRQQPKQRKYGHNNHEFLRHAGMSSACPQQYRLVKKQINNGMMSNRFRTTQNKNNFLGQRPWKQNLKTKIL